MNQIGSLLKRQLVISADRRDVCAWSCGLTSATCKSAATGLVFVVYFRVTFIRGILGGLCKRAQPFLRGPRTSFVSFILAM